ncbi:MULTISPECIES: membrane protein YczE [Microbacterium]|jgi:uncharacterized membrane protein YczE|uniref:Membrane protein YczE n=1 Tax=Microbacterium schleiferi TaxID=69362 RepID=A0ABU7V6D0_9MICO|nr:hypothetical protein [Microbacterium sp. 67-17]OJV98553.1 MAG: hypothetical protein BGO47_00930 [Microbacterium sp. 67-17]
MPRRILQLLIGLPLYGVGAALTVDAGLGVDPWTVLAEGLSIRTGIGVGWMTNILGLLILLLWIPLRQRPGIGTLANILILGTAMQLTLWVLPPVSGFLAQLGVLICGILLVAIASGLYIGARFGPGPRDGLMTGLHSRFGMPIWAARASVELTVLIIGWLLGGTVGLGTVLFAATIGPLVHITLPLLDTQRKRVPSPSASAPVTPLASPR